MQINYLLPGKTTLVVLAAVFAACLSVGDVVASDWTIDDLIREEQAKDWTVSRDGRSASFVKSTVVTIEKEDVRVSNLWLARLDREDTRALTRGKNQVSAPVFSPDGKTIAFLSDRDLPDNAKKDDPARGKKQVWLISIEGGEAWPLTSFDQDVTAINWRDNERLIVLAPESRSAWSQKREDIGDTTTIVEDADRQPFVRLFEVSIDGLVIRRLTDNRNWINSVSVSPDGKLAVYTAQRSLSYQFDEKITPGTFLLSLESGAAKPILEDRRYIPHSFSWFPDSTGFYFANNESDHPLYTAASVTQLYSYEVADDRFEKVDLDWSAGLAESFGASKDGFVALLAEGVNNRLARYEKTRKGWRREDLKGPRTGNVDNLVLSLDGTSMVFTHSTATVPPQAFVARLDTNRLVQERQLTKLNPSFDDKNTGRIEIVQWQGARGDTVDGIVHYPLNWQEGQRYPLVLDIHGGPTSRDRDTWEQDWHDPGILYRQRGAFVLQMNYHGSTGYGLEWVTSISDGLYYELAYQDIEAGVDYLIERGLVDAEKLGTAGWSNGGILSAELITRSKRYKAASIGAADVEWISDWANVDFGAAFDNYYLGASPFENPQIYLELSPFFKLPEVATPTLIITGTADRNVPPHQSWSLYRALQQTTDTPARLVLFPGEPHSIAKPAHQRRKLEEEMAWMDRYLFERAEQDDSWLKDESPLTALLQRAASRHTRSGYGVDHAGVLIPETVRYAGFELGRFEVTRAQYQQFDSSYPVEAGEENLPASGLSFAQAKDYANWLAGLTGMPYRLPTAIEAKKISATLKKTQGNTLSWWTGYQPNPEDFSQIQQALAATGQAAPLLQSVGSFTGQGEAPVFDLDGNVSEWVSDGDSGLAFGPSADIADDARNTGAVAAPAYRGLRILLDTGTP